MRRSSLSNSPIANHVQRAGARDLYERAGQKEAFVEPHLALGTLALGEHRLDDAAESYRRALDAGPSDIDQRAEAYRGLGTAHLRAGRFDRAVRELRKAVASAPDDPVAQTLLGRALLGKRDLDTARIVLERATRKEPAPPDAWAALGEVLLELGRGDDAEKAFRAALAGIAAGAPLPEAEVRARLGLARRLRGVKLVDEAQVELARALALDPGNLALLVELGLTAKTPDVALDAFDRALHPSATDSRALVDPRPLLEQALAISLASGLVDRAVGYAEALRLRSIDHPVARG
jgi:tetratricopeptide (TPR) repeat protein